MGIQGQAVSRWAISQVQGKFCVRGEMHTENVDFFESWSPVVAWSTVHLILTLVISHGWESRPIDFSNAFVHYRRRHLHPSPPNFEPDENQGDQEVIMKLNKSLNGFQAAGFFQWFLPNYTPPSPGANV
jgi:Reverse transcriptase (RNA-dependent DNA polymerase)